MSRYGTIQECTGVNMLDEWIVETRRNNCKQQPDISMRMLAK